MWGFTVEHCGHENVVPGAIDERHVPHQLHLLIFKPRHRAVRRVRGGGAVSAVARGPRAEVIFALVDFGVGISQLDRDVAFLRVYGCMGLGFRI